MYSKKEKAVAKKLCLELRGKTCIEIRDILRVKGFKEFAWGCYKRAYIIPECPTLIIKVYNNRFSRHSSGGRKVIKYLSVLDSFLKSLAHNRRFIIQKKCNNKGGNKATASNRVWREILRKKIKVDDIHSGNCAFHDGKPYFFDYSLKPHYVKT